MLKLFVDVQRTAFLNIYIFYCLFLNNSPNEAEICSTKVIDNVGFLRHNCFGFFF